MDKLIIFDCDGVLVDSEIIANQVDAEFFTNFGYPVTAEETIKRFTGISDKVASKMIFEESGIHIPKHHWEGRQELIMKALESELKPLMVEVLKKVAQLNKKRCVASNSGKDRVVRSLALTNQLQFFIHDSIFSAEQVKRGKPAPDLFLFAADQMKHDPKNCVVIEDSMVGIEAALDAKMQVIGFLGGTHAQYDWYKKNVKAWGVPIAHDAKELLQMIK